jgi:ribokinase
VRRRADARPIHSVVIVDRRTGQRTLFYSLSGVADLEVADVRPEVIGACRVLLVDSTVAIAVRAVDLARRAGVAVVADLEHPGGAGVPELVQKVDHLIVGLDFARGLTGARNPEEMLRGLWRPSQAACVVTGGDRGCWYLARETGSAVQHRAASRVDVVDTNGCGDVFHGAYAARIARGDSVASAVAVATVAAGQKATQPGPRQGIPDWPTVSRLLEATDGGATSAASRTDAAQPTRVATGPHA